VEADIGPLLLLVNSLMEAPSALSKAPRSSESSFWVGENRDYPPNRQTSGNYWAILTVFSGVRASENTGGIRASADHSLSLLILRLLSGKS
jgi:hypothetical protein